MNDNERRDRRDYGYSIEGFEKRVPRKKLNSDQQSGSNKRVSSPNSTSPDRTSVNRTSAERRRKKRLKKKLNRILRIGMRLAPYVLALIAIIVVLVLGIKGLISLFSGKKDTPIADEVSENIVSISEDELLVMPEPEEKDLFYDPEKYGLFSGNEVTFTANSREFDQSTFRSTYGILLNASTGEVLYSLNPTSRMVPASMTKIMTLIVAAEHITNLDDEVIVTEEATAYAWKNDCSSAGFLNDEKVTVRDLLYGTILPSGGEAAYTLAVYVAGSQEAFVDMMNDKLEELGLSDSAHFTNCVGIYNDNHYCTVADMAIILKEAISNELCREVLSAHIYTTSETEQHPEGIEISNWFLRRIEDKENYGTVIFAKTGYVSQSGNCAASYAEDSSGNKYICVTAGAANNWKCIFDHFESYDIYMAPK